MTYLPAWQGVTFNELFGPSQGGPVPFPFNAQHTTYFHTARSAIYQLFLRLVRSGRTRVLVPDYHMGNEIRAIRAAGADVVLYPVHRNMQPDLDRVRRLAQGADALFTIHYAGWPQPVRELRTLCDEQGMVLVEDCALALMTESAGRSVGTFGDYAVFCLYKALPVLDGGLLVQNRHVFPDLDTMALQPIGTAFEVGRIGELWIERFRNGFPRAGALLADFKRRIGSVLTAVHVKRVPVGDIGFHPEETTLAMSAWSAHLFPRLNYDEIRLRRRTNFQLLAHLLRPAGLSPALELEPGVCPLFFPLLVRDKGAVARAFWARGVMVTELWNEGDPASSGLEGADAQFLRRHVLELPIHQDIGEAQIRYMARQVTELKGALELERNADEDLAVLASRC